MTLYCLLCRKESGTNEYEPCPHCGARGKWAQLTEDFKDDSGRKIDPRIQCPNGVIHNFKQVKDGKEERCIKCGWIKEHINALFESHLISCSG